MRILFSVLVCATPRPYSLKSSTPCLVKCNVSGLNLAECFTTLYWCEVNETKNERRNVSVAQADTVCGTGCQARLWSWHPWARPVPELRVRPDWSPEFMDLDYTQQGVLLRDERRQNQKSVSSIYCYCCEGGGFIHIFLLWARKLCLLLPFYLRVSIQQFIMKIYIL